MGPTNTTLILTMFTFGWRWQIFVVKSLVKMRRRVACRPHICIFSETNLDFLTFNAGNRQRNDQSRDQFTSLPFYSNSIHCHGWGKVLYWGVVMSPICNSERYCRPRLADIGKQASSKYYIQWWTCEVSLLKSVGTCCVSTGARIEKVTDMGG